MTKRTGPRRRRQTKQINNSTLSVHEKDNWQVSVQQKSSSEKCSLFAWIFSLVGTVAIIVIIISIQQSMGNVEEQGQEDASRTIDPKWIESKGKSDTATVTYRGHYELLDTFPHDPTAFTQGLTFANGKLYEGTGLHGQSELRHIDPRTGTVLKSHQLANQFFGEGIAHYTNKEGVGLIIQLTWKEQTGFVYNADTFEVVKEFQYNTTTNEGWGIAYNEAEKEFIVSDGSEWLHFWDRDTLREKRRVPVVFLQNNPDNADDELLRTPIRYLNELEMDEHGFILSNVWFQDVLIRIDPSTGNVQQIYYFPDLYTDRIVGADCFNGISVTDKKDEFYVTGKKWPFLYRIKLS